MNDLVSYNGKHNEANGEGNRDGADDNRSWNCGVEGPTDDAAIEELRNRQVKNFLTVTLLSIGVPMILMGDEVRRTQHGNNNAYCHDNELNWFDWTLVAKHADVHRFVTLLNQRRILRPVEHERQRMTLAQLIQQANKSWHGVKVGQPDWSPTSHSVALNAEIKHEGFVGYFIFNAYWEHLEFELPMPPGSPWRRWIDTALDSPMDIVPWRTLVPVTGLAYQVATAVGGRIGCRPHGHFKMNIRSVLRGVSYGKRRKGDGNGNSKLKRKEYEKELRRLQVELCHLQAWVKHKGLRIIILFEGRDGAGKGRDHSRDYRTCQSRVCSAWWRCLPPPIAKRRRCTYNAT